MLSLFAALLLANEYDKLQDIEDNEPFPQVPPRPSCLGQNTFLDRSGNCRCKEGYDYGNASDINGCWRCQNKCDKNANCIFPGICECKKEYVGDGSTCKLVLPVMKGMEPETGPVGTTVNISFSYNISMEYDAAYCRFGTFPVTAFQKESKYILCHAPLLKSNSAKVSISFDAIHWSTEEYIFTYTEKNSNLKNVIKVIILISLLAFISILVYQRFAKKEKAEEDEPLLQGGPKGKQKVPDLSKKRNIL